MAVAGGLYLLIAQVEPARAAEPATPGIPADLLRSWVGRSPGAVDAGEPEPGVPTEEPHGAFWALPAVEIEMKRVLGAKRFRQLATGWGAGYANFPGGRYELLPGGTATTFMACKPHDCAGYIAQVFFGLADGRVRVCWGEGTRHTWLSPLASERTLAQGTCNAHDSTALLARYDVPDGETMTRGRRLAFSKKAGLEVFVSGSAWCREGALGAQLEVVGTSRTVFANPELGTTLQRVGRDILAKECPAASVARYRGFIGKSKDWEWEGRAEAPDWLPETVSQTAQLGSLPDWRAAAAAVVPPPAPSPTAAADGPGADAGDATVAAPDASVAAPADPLPPGPAPTSARADAAGSTDAPAPPPGQRPTQAQAGPAAPGQSTVPPPAAGPAAAPHAASGKADYPGLLAKLEVAGVRLGMRPSEVRAALAAFDPAYEVADVVVRSAGTLVPFPSPEPEAGSTWPGVLSLVTATRHTDEAHDHVGVTFMPEAEQGTDRERAVTVFRWKTYLTVAPTVASLEEAARAKTGVAPSLSITGAPRGAAWVFNVKGAVLPAAVAESVARPSVTSFVAWQQPVAPSRPGGATLDQFAASVSDQISRQIEERYRGGRRMPGMAELPPAPEPTAIRSDGPVSLQLSVGLHPDDATLAQGFTMQLTDERAAYIAAKKVDAMIAAAHEALLRARQEAARPKVAPAEKL